MTGKHTGNFLEIPGTGKRVDFTGSYVVRNANGRIVEHRGEEDGVRLLQQPGVL